MATPETSSALLTEIANLSAKALAGTITDEELKRGLALLRQERMSIKGPAKKAKSADGDAELESLLNL
jgi:hypothetical protein